MIAVRNAALLVGIEEVAEGKALCNESMAKHLFGGISPDVFGAARAASSGPAAVGSVLHLPPDNTRKVPQYLCPT